MKTWWLKRISGNGKEITGC